MFDSNILCLNVTVTMITTYSGSHSHWISIGGNVAKQHLQLHLVSSLNLQVKRFLSPLKPDQE